MIATQKQIKIISKYLWSQGHGSKKILAESIPCHQSEITRFLKTGAISVERLAKIFSIIEENNK